MTPVYIFDLDGTLADNSHRTHLVQGEKKDWVEYYKQCEKDKPIWSVIKVFQALKKTSDCWIWSGRSDEVKDATIAWLWRYGLLNGRTPEHWLQDAHILMRPQGDYSKNKDLKEKWFRQWFSHRPELFDRKVAYASLFGVFEDHPETAIMWRSLGITCFELESKGF